MPNENIIVNSLWIGKELSNLELLTVHSFLEHGHSFRLWTYDEIATKLPYGAELCDASDIIPASKVFSYKHSNKYGHGKGSYAGFSDVFRYKLLYEQGGWWVDMDVTCLKPFSFNNPYFFRSHHTMPVVGSVMRAPKNNALMRLCYEEAVLNIDSDNKDWHKPIDILNKYIEQESLLKYVEEKVSNCDSWAETSAYIWTGKELPQEWFFIHWQNEEWRAQKINRNSFYYKSAIAGLMARYKLTALPADNWGKWVNHIAHSRVGRRLTFSS